MGPAAIVTGASSGMGEGIARALAADGLGVALAARRRDRLETIATELGAEAMAVPTDVTSSEEVGRLVAVALERFRRLDVVVTSAGVYAEGALEDMGEREWDRTLAVNLKGTFLVARAALPHLRASGGHLIGISSTSGTTGEAGLSAYAASKWGVRGLLATVAEEASGDGVRTTVICPGYTATPMSGYTEAAPDLIAVDDVVETVRWLLRLRPVVGVREIVLERLGSRPAA